MTVREFQEKIRDIYFEKDNGRGVAGVPTPVPQGERGTIDAERLGTHHASNLRTMFWNFGMVGDYPRDPRNTDLSVFHSVEVPKGSGINYSDGITPFVLTRIVQRNGLEAYIMETGFRERQAYSPQHNRMMRFEPRMGYIQPSPVKNPARSPAISHDPRTWPDSWPDKLDDPYDKGWEGSWNGYFGKRTAADQESYMVMDDDFYDAWDYFPDSRDSTRNGLGLRVEVRGFQWANPQASNVIFWHYDITNESTTDYDDDMIFGLYMDSGVGGSMQSCDGIFESDDDNAFFDRRFNDQVINLVYTWDNRNTGVGLGGNCEKTGYLGYAYLETPGKPTDGADNDEDGITDEKRYSASGDTIAIVGRDAILQYAQTHYDMARFTAEYGPIANRLAYRAGVWWIGDEDMDWSADLHDTGADGVWETSDFGEGDGKPTDGETNFDRTDLHESDQIGLTGFKMNRIAPGIGSPSDVDNVLFYTESAYNWPERLFRKFTSESEAERFDLPLVLNYNIGFLFASGPFTLKAGQTERFSLALAYGGDLDELRRTVRTVQQIYNANYQFAVPPPPPTVSAETGDGYVRLSWNDLPERAVDPVTYEFDFEGYRIYRSTDPDFRDPRVVSTGTGSGPLGNGRPIAQFDLADSIKGFSPQSVEGVSYYLGLDTGLRHTWTDTTVTNGQEYYYAVCSYDYGSDSLGFYPSENAINVSRTPRGGTILPGHIVQVRPEPKVLGYVPASVTTTAHLAGGGSGSVEIEVVNSGNVDDGHVYKVTFQQPSPDSVRASGYTLVDSTQAGKLLFKTGRDLEGLGRGPVAAGVLPIVTTPRIVTVDKNRSGFIPTSPTNTRLKVSYQTGGYLLPINQRRPGFPEDLSIVFDDAFVDTSVAPDISTPRRPAKFRVFAHANTGDVQMDFIFGDLDADGTLSTPAEYVDVATYGSALPGVPLATWRAQLDTLGQSQRGPIQPPRAGDVYELHLIKPFSNEDVFTFTVTGEKVDPDRAEEGSFKPYVVPNPYLGAASFEPERYAIAGRGERRIEFRGLPKNAVIRIYTVRGDLVQTLYQAGSPPGPRGYTSGSDEGSVAWNLRTKDNLDVAPGLYIYHVDGGRVGNYVGKFAIIK
jgi:hypothetical protein